MLKNVVVGTHTLTGTHTMQLRLGYLLLICYPSSDISTHPKWVLPVQRLDGHWTDLYIKLWSSYFHCLFCWPLFYQEVPCHQLCRSCFSMSTGIGWYLWHCSKATSVINN